MTSLLLNAAPVDYQDNININKNLKEKNFSKKQQKNKTIKNENPKKIKPEMLKETFESSDDEDDYNDNEDLKNFKPVQEENIKNNNNALNFLNSDKNNETYVSDYYKNYLKTVQANRNIESITNNELLKKLDNILYILEDQTEERNSYVTEELILYIFLGIFIIYVLDSFVRVGKYTR